MASSWKTWPGLVVLFRMSSLLTMRRLLICFSQRTLCLVSVGMMTRATGSWWIWCLFWRDWLTFRMLEIIWELSLRTTRSIMIRLDLFWDLSILSSSRTQKARCRQQKQQATIAWKEFSQLHSYTSIVSPRLPTKALSWSRISKILRERRIKFPLHPQHNNRIATKKKTVAASSIHLITSKSSNKSTRSRRLKLMTWKSASCSTLGQRRSSNNKKPRHSPRKRHWPTFPTRSGLPQSPTPRGKSQRRPKASHSQSTSTKSTWELCKDSSSRREPLHTMRPQLQWKRMYRRHRKASRMRICMVVWSRTHRRDPTQHIVITSLLSTDRIARRDRRLHLSLQSWQLTRMVHPLRRRRTRRTTWITSTSPLLLRNSLTRAPIASSRLPNRLASLTTKIQAPSPTPSQKPVRALSRPFSKRTRSCERISRTF